MIVITQSNVDIPNAFDIKTYIDAKSKITIEIMIEQYLKRKCDFNHLNIAILNDFNDNIMKNYKQISYEFTINDKKDIDDIKIYPNIIKNITNISKQKCIVKGHFIANNDYQKWVLPLVIS